MKRLMMAGCLGMVLLAQPVAASDTLLLMGELAISGDEGRAAVAKVIENYPVRPRWRQFEVQH